MKSDVMKPADGNSADANHPSGYESSWRSERESLYQRLALSPAQQRAIEELVRLSPARKVGKGALRNVRGTLPSKKCNAPRILESHTVERPFLYALELDPCILGYVTQVPLSHVERRLANGRRHVTSATLDVLVFSRDAVTLVECKDLSWLRQQDGKRGWSCQDGIWTCAPYADWAEQRGLGFRVWHPPYPYAIYLRNLELMFARLGDPLEALAEAAAAKLPRLLRNHVLTWKQLREQLPALDGRALTILLGQRQLFGTIRSDPIGSDTLRLFGDEAKALEADLAILEGRAQALGTPDEDVPATVPSIAAAERAMQRLRCLEAIARGEKPPTRRMRELAKKVAEAVQKGIAPFDACLPNFHECGNRLARLDETQQALLTSAVLDFQGQKAPLPIVDAYARMDTACLEAQVVTPSRTTLSRAIQVQDPAVRALNTGGLRAYQKVAPRSDPRMRSGAAMGFLHTVHFDSSKRDVRASAELQPLINQRRALKDEGGRGYDTFYIAVDEATGLIVGHAFLIGPSRTEGVALLMREIVRRHGALPRLIIKDRGSENQSLWLKEFALKQGMTVLDTMTAGSRFNGQAEHRIGQINARICQRLPGSTAPDQAGRSVDSKFKSLHTARLKFLEICELIEAFLYEDLPNIPDANGETPRMRQEAVVSQLGMLGIPRQLDGDLMFETSPRWTGKFTATEKRGIRIANHDFISTEVRSALRIGQPQELRLDGCDPTLLHVVISNRRLRAFHGTVQQRAAQTPNERLWLRLVEPVMQAANREEKTKVGRALAQRMERSRKGAAAHPELQPQAFSEVDEAPSKNDGVSRWDELWDDAAAASQ